MITTRTSFCRLSDVKRQVHRPPSCSVIDEQANVVSASTWFLSFHSHHAASL
jgi:hypothetical protein